MSLDRQDVGVRSTPALIAVNPSMAGTMRLLPRAKGERVSTVFGKFSRRQSSLLADCRLSIKPPWLHRDRGWKLSGRCPGHGVPAHRLGLPGRQPAAE